MKSKFFFFLAFLVLALAVLPFLRSRPETLPWHRNKDDAFDSARSSHRQVLAFLYTDWCTYCRQMDDETFQDPGVVEELGSRFVWLRLNAETSVAGSELQQRFGVDGYPTLLILDENENEIDRVSGYVPPDQFAQRVESLIEGPDSFPKLRQQVEEHPDSAEAHFRIAAKYLERQRFEEAAEHFRTTVTLDPNNRSGFTDAGLYYVAGAEAMLGRIDEALATSEQLRRRYPESKYATDSLLMQAQLLIQSGEGPEARTLLAQFLKDHPDHRAADQIRQLLGGDSF